MVITATPALPLYPCPDDQIKDDMQFTLHARYETLKIVRSRHFAIRRVRGGFGERQAGAC